MSGLPLWPFARALTKALHGDDVGQRARPRHAQIAWERSAFVALSSGTDQGASQGPRGDDAGHRARPRHTEESSKVRSAFRPFARALTKALSAIRLGAGPWYRIS